MKSPTHSRSRSTAAGLSEHARAAAELTDPAFADGLRERLRAAIARPGSDEQLERMRTLLRER